MPEPQTGTSTVVATDVDTAIRLGIGRNSVGTLQAHVKSLRASRSVECLAGSTRSNCRSGLRCRAGLRVSDALRRS
jgi:hypothetical protein